MPTITTEELLALPDDMPKKRTISTEELFAIPVKETPTPTPPSISQQKPPNAFQTYMREAQPAFKFATQYPYELMKGTAGQLPLSAFEEKPWADILRQSPAMPFRQSTTTLGQSIPEYAGTLLDIGTRPSAYIIPKILSLPSVNRFLTKPRGFVKFGRKAVQQVAEKGEKGLDTVFNQMSDKYDDLFAKIKDGKTDVTDIWTSVQEAVENYPQGTNISKIKTLADRLGEKQSMTATELHALKQEVRKIIPKSVWKTGEADAIQNAQRNIYFKINDALERIGGKAYKGLSQEFRELSKMADDVNSIILERGRAGDVKLHQAKPSYRQMEAMKKLNEMLLPKERFMHEFEAWKRGQLLKKIAYLTGGAGLLYGLRRKIGGGAFGGGGY